MRAGTVAEPSPREVPCVIDHLHRDMAVAEDARAGRFTHAGVTLELGRRPDWIAGGLSGDEEWRIEWVKLYEGLDMAHAYALTGDEDHLEAWQDLVEAFCDQVPVGHDSSDVSARRLQNWLYAWQRFAAAPSFGGLRPGLAARLVERVDADAAHLSAHLTPERNHRTMELYTLLLAGLALGRPAMAAGALDELGRNAESDILEDGVQRERSTDYHCIVLRSLLGAIDCARRFAMTPPDALVDRADRACDFALHVQRPDGTTPSLSDGDVGDFRILLEFGGELLGRDDLLWAATGGRRGAPPRRRMVTFPAGGYSVQRSGWGEGDRPYGQERLAILDHGPLGDGGHGHYDQLSVELVGAGRTLVVDPGRFTYAEEGGWRAWFKGTAAHNTVCVDDLDQTPYRRGKPKGPAPSARLVGRVDAPGVDLVVAEARSPRHDAVHARHLALVDGDYWVVHDRMRAPTPHHYAARWHLTPEAWGRVVVETDPGQTSVQAPGVTLIVPRGCGAVAIEDGWVSAEYGVKHPAPVVVVESDGAGDADLLTVIVPRDRRARAAVALSGPEAAVTVVLSRGGHRVRWACGESPAVGCRRLPW